MKRVIKTVLDEVADRAAAALASHQSEGTPRAGVLAAVSGGADSTALALILARLTETDRLPGALTLAHVDHGQHPDSRRAAAAVRTLATALGLPHRARRLALGPGPHGEAALRAARYDALLAMARDVGATLVVTAHHADDQLETVLFRVLRGAGPAGLAGIPQCRPLASGIHVLRPLLAVPQRQLLRLIAESGQPVFEDPSNRELRFARNRLRHDVLPRLRRRHGDRLDATLQQLAAAAGRVAGALERGALALLADRARHVTSWRIELETAGIDPAHRPFLEEAVRRLLRLVDGRCREPSWNTVQRVADLIGEPAGTRVHGPDQPLAERLREGLLFIDPSRAGTPPPVAASLAFHAGAQRFGTTEWRVEAAPRSFGPPLDTAAPDRWRVWLDPTLAPPPWRMRLRRAGDRFWPLGMAGPVDLRGFLAARHVPRFDRERLPLVVDSRDDVVWIPGVEIGHAARRRAGTAGCIELWTDRLG